MASETVSIVGLNKAQVLAALYNGAKPQGAGFIHYDPKPMDEAEAERILQSGQTYFDYLKGRVMKVDLSGDEIDPYLYDRDNGRNRVDCIMDEVKSQCYRIAAPPVGFEPTTLKLTVSCSTAELQGNITVLKIIPFKLSAF